MAPFTLKHPFMNGGGEIPKDKIEDVRRVQSWIKTQPTLPKLTEHYILDYYTASTYTLYLTFWQSHRLLTGERICPDLLGPEGRSPPLTSQQPMRLPKDEHVYTFLHANYYDVASAQNTISSYFSLRTSAPDIFLNQSPQSPEMQSALNILCMAPLPNPTPEGYKVIIYKLADPDPEKFVHLHVSKAMILFNDVRLSEDGITPGYVVVCDARGFSFSHLTKLNLHVLRVYLKYMQEAKPIRLKGLHVIYSAKIIDKLVSLVKPFMKAELQRVLKIHAGNDLTNFFKFVPQEIMPEDYGGQAKPSAVLNDMSRKLIEVKYPKWLEEECAFLADASKLQKKKSKISLQAEEAVESLRHLSID